MSSTKRFIKPSQPLPCFCLHEIFARDNVPTFCFVLSLSPEQPYVSYSTKASYVFISKDKLTKDMRRLAGQIWGKQWSLSARSERDLRSCEVT